MQTINTSNNSKLNPKFSKHPRKWVVMRKNEKDEIVDSVTCEGILKPNQDCNRCKAQRMPRYQRQHGRTIPTLLKYLQANEIGTIMTSRAFMQRGMIEEAHDMNEFDGINLRFIQARRRRERDQAQKWKRGGHLIEHKTTHPHMFDSLQADAYRILG